MKKYLLPLLLISGSAFGYDFKGIELGSTSSYEAVSNTLSIKCHESKNGKVWCGGETTIVGNPAKAHINLSSDKTVEAISIKFSPSSFESIASGLISKYGEPKTENSIISNAMGASFNQTVMIWKDDKNYMKLEKYSNKVTEGNLWMITNSKVNELTIQGEKNKSDL
jgi:hypothetical protein